MQDQNRAPRVFVTQEVRSAKTNIDYTPAKRFGEVHFLTVMDFSSDDNSPSNRVLVEELRTRLQDYNPKTDYIVITGSPMVAAVVFMILRERTTSVKFLRWSNRDFRYNEVTIDIV